MDILTLSEEIEGKRIIIKKHEVKSAQQIFDEVNCDRERLGLFLPWVDVIKTVEDEICYIKKCNVEWSDCKGFDYGIFLKEGNYYLGNIGVHSISWENDLAEIGYWITGRNKGKGFVSEAVSILEKELFKVGFNRVQIRCDSRNERSGSVPKRCGYIHEGTLRENIRDRGLLRNTEVYSKLKSEYYRID